MITAAHDSYGTLAHTTFHLMACWNYIHILSPRSNLQQQCFQIPYVNYTTHPMGVGDLPINGQKIWYFLKQLLFLFNIKTAFQVDARKKLDNNFALVCTHCQFPKSSSQPEDAGFVHEKKMSYYCKGCGDPCRGESRSWGQTVQPPGPTVLFSYKGASLGPNLPD